MSTATRWTVMTMTDDIAPGIAQSVSIDAEDAIKRIDMALSLLEVDRRTAMPDDEDSLEHRLRTARQELAAVRDDLDGDGDA